MKTTKLKENRVKLLTLSVVITSLTLTGLHTLLYLNDKGVINTPFIIDAKVNSITLVLTTLFVTSLLLRLTIKKVYGFFDEAEEKLFYSKIYTWALYSISLFIILHHFGVSLGNITIFVGLITTGLAFAIRDVLLSFFGWMILLRKRPFRIGDYIRIENNEGKVMHIGTFYVLIDNIDELPDDYIKVPNKLFLEKSITKLGKDFYNDKVCLQISQMPDNPKRFLKTIQQNLEEHLHNQQRILTYFDVKDDKLLICTEYLVKFRERHLTRSEVITIVHKTLTDKIDQNR